MNNGNSSSPELENKAIRKMIIVGGGTAGWMVAAAFSRMLPKSCQISLIESDQISTIGVGEATIPSIRAFNQMLNLDEDEFIKQTQATFKLGIEFVNWGKPGDSYIHGFGQIGRDQIAVKFYQFWLKMYQAGKAPDLEEFSINTVAPRLSKFMRPPKDMPNSPLSDISYAFHFDAGLYAKYLRRVSEQSGVERIEGKITNVVCRDKDGWIDQLIMENGDQYQADLFIDCSGLAGLLIEKTLKTGYEDWSHFLPVNNAIAVPCKSFGKLHSHTRSTAHHAGWQWRIPLQHRTGNGHVYCDRFMSADEAQFTLLNHLDGEALAEPRHIKFTTGKRIKAWNKNCVAIGLSSGFMEPLESTSIHMIQTAINRLISLFPDREFSQVDIDTYNEQSDEEYLRIRDFLIMHYKLNEHPGTPFWDYCRTMEVPLEVQKRIDLYKSHGRIIRMGDELFAEASWLQVMHGQGLKATSYHPLVDQRSEEEIAFFLEQVSKTIKKCVDAMSSHADFIANTCSANV